jgi:glycosyltransferase involved in cell wall biosynthesis
VPLNLGVGGALRCGFRWALANGYDVAVQLDADGQHDPHEIASLLRAMTEENADLVVGSRFADGSGEYEEHPARRFAMGLLARRAERATGTKVIDSTSGFRAIRRPLLDKFAANYPVEYLGDTVEALIEAGLAGATIVEHPISASPRAHGSGSAGVLASIWYVARVLVAVELMHNRRKRLSSTLPSAHGAS